MRNKILYADDDPQARDLAERIFNKKFPNYVPEFFENGTSLAKRLQQNLDDVALVLTDNDMPGISGYKLIRDYANKISPPMVLCSGGDKSIGEKALEEGAKLYLAKPFLLSDFIDSINSVIGSYENK